MRIVALLAGLGLAVGCGQQTTPTSSPSEIGTGATKRAVPEKPAAPVKVVTGDTATIGDLRVTVESATRGYRGNSLSICIVCYTTNPGKNLQFRPWSEEAKAMPPVRDDLGNTYLPQDDFAEARAVRDLIPANEWFAAKGFARPPQCQRGVGGVTADVARMDNIYYQLPAPSAKRVTIDLPAEQVGGTGTLRFTVALPVEKKPSKE